MNPAPAIDLLAFAVSMGCALALIAVAAVVGRFALPRLEGWCARQDAPLIAALAVSEDAGLPWAAKRRARELFLSKLDERQRRSWHLRRRFDVVAGGGRRYTIGSYRSFNVSSGDAVFCVEVEGRIPVYDKLLAQKLLIESDEQLFLARANVRTLSRAWTERMAQARAERRRADENLLRRVASGER
jgi:hypothetical protein